MKYLRLENVKAFKDTGLIEIAPITIFVGRNSCGKSSLIRFPVIMSQTFKSRIETPICLSAQQADFIDYGNISDVLHKHTAKSFTSTFTYPISLHRFLCTDKVLLSRIERSAARSYQDTAAISITYSATSNNERVQASQIKLYINNSLVSTLTRNSSRANKVTYKFEQKLAPSESELVPVDYSYSVTPMQLQHFLPSFSIRSIYFDIGKHLGVTDTEHMSLLVRNIGMHAYRENDIEDESIIRFEDLNDIDKKIVQIATAFSFSIRVYDYLYRMMEDEFLSLHYIGPFRSAPKRLYRQDEVAHDDVGTYGDYASSLLINDAIDHKNGSESNSLVNGVSNWMEAALNYRINVSELGTNTGYYQLAAEDPITGQASNIMDVGYGISQVLPIVTQLKLTAQRQYAAARRLSSVRPSRSNPSSTIFVIEQPELHLHPAAQSELAKLFTSVIGNDPRENVQLLIETHSEHLIRALQVMVADPANTLSNKDVKFYYIDKTDNGESIVTEMTVNEYGQFNEQWPTGFFDRSYTLSKDLIRAIAERKHQEGK